MAGMSEFLLCINNQGYEASLIVGKVYRRVPDAEAEQRMLVRVLDEDDDEMDGYLYPTTMFVPIDLPEVAREALLAAHG